jgi:hypothetical protein
VNAEFQLQSGDNGYTSSSACLEACLLTSDTLRKLAAAAVAGWLEQPGTINVAETYINKLCYRQPPRGPGTVH